MLKMVSLEEGNWRVMESDSNDVNTDEDEEERMVAGSRTTKAMPPPSLSEIDSECFDGLGLVLVFFCFSFRVTRLANNRVSWRDGRGKLGRCVLGCNPCFSQGYNIRIVIDDVVLKG